MSRRLQGDTLWSDFFCSWSAKLIFCLELAVLFYLWGHAALRWWQMWTTSAQTFLGPHSGTRRCSRIVTLVGDLDAGICLRHRWGLCACRHWLPAAKHPHTTQCFIPQTPDFWLSEPLEKAKNSPEVRLERPLFKKHNTVKSWAGILHFIWSTFFLSLKLSCEMLYAHFADKEMET